MATVTGAAQIDITSSVLVADPVRFTPTAPDSSSIRTLLYIDDKPLTNHNRNFSVSDNPIYVQNVNWNNKRTRYYKRQSNAARKTFNISWSFLPNFREKTADFRYGRDFIRDLAEDPDVHVLKIVNQDESGTTAYTETTYNVFVRSYNEDLIRRDIADGVYYFDCSISLEEA